MMLGERIASQSEVIRAIFLECSPCCGVPHRLVDSEDELGVPKRLRRVHLERSALDLLVVKLPELELAVRVRSA